MLNKDTVDGFMLNKDIGKEDGDVLNKDTIEEDRFKLNKEIVKEDGDMLNKDITKEGEDVLLGKTFVKKDKCFDEGYWDVANKDIYLAMLLGTIFSVLA